MAIKGGRMVLVLLFGMSLSGVARAGDIFYSNLQFNDPIFQPASGNDASYNSSSVPGEGGTYTISAEICQTGSCANDNPSAATDQLRLTNVSLFCSAIGSCAPIDISFQANGSTDATFVMFALSLDSISGVPANGGFARICIADSSHICSADGSGTQSTSFPLTSGFTSNLVTLNFFPNGPFTVVGDLHLVGLSNGNTLTIANSFKITDLPEPGTIVLLPAGLTALWAIRRRRTV